MTVPVVTLPYQAISLLREGHDAVLYKVPGDQSSRGKRIVAQNAIRRAAGKPGLVKTRFGWRTSDGGTMFVVASPKALASAA